MFSEEGKVCLLMIEFLNLFPTLFRMALRAEIPQSSSMLVIFPVTRGALGGNLVTLLNMAFCAGDRDVFSNQPILCGRVVENDPFPFLGDMAAIALPTELPFVSVLLLVALKADLRRLLKARGLMALQAGGLLMTSKQLESGLIVVEEDLFPRDGRMTCLAPIP